jgi:hypothetical protein
VTGLVTNWGSSGPPQEDQMGRIIVIMFVLGGVFLAIHGLKNELNNMVNLRHNIETIIGE